jgi:hypothetical protein
MKVGCDGYLFDSTIDFGDNLPSEHIQRGYKLACEAELCIVLGSRCSVSPACDMPISVGQSRRKLVVVNLQRTGADSVASLRIGAKIDDVMIPLMRRLGVEIPHFKLERRVWVEKDTEVVSVRAVDADGLADDALWNVQVKLQQAKSPPSQDDRVHVKFNNDVPAGKKGAPQPGDDALIDTWPWLNCQHFGMLEVSVVSGPARGSMFSVSADVCEVQDAPSIEAGVQYINGGVCHGAALEHRLPAGARGTCLNVMFRAHYGEPPLPLPWPVVPCKVLYRLQYDPLQGEWAEPQVLEGSPKGDMERSRVASRPTVDEMKAVMMLVSAKEEFNGDQYRCFHRLHITAEDGTPSTTVQSVRYSMPGQGFRQDTYHVSKSPFELKLGPCWGRPHVTVDLTWADGSTTSTAFSQNLPRADSAFVLNNAAAAG